MERVEDSALADGLWAAARALRRAARSATSPWDVSPSQARALGAIARLGPLRLRALADELRIAPRSVTEVVDTLEARGWVTRRPDPTDRRATIVALSATGTRVQRDIDDARRDSAGEVFGRLSSRDRAQLVRLLEKITTAE